MLSTKMINRYVFGLCALFVVSACDISENEVEPSESFLRIYDNNTFNSSFTPIDVQQTTDGGYLILGGTRVEDSDFWGVYLMKVDEQGLFISEENLSTEYVSPAKSLMNINGTFYFMAMTDISWQANLFALNDSGRVSTITPLPGRFYPMYCEADGETIIAQTYNNGSKNTNLALISTEGNILNDANFTIGDGDDTEEPIVTHFTRTGRQLPFFAGKVDNGLYYFNGFYDFTLSTIFTDLSGNNEDGVVGRLQGFRDEDGMSSAIHLGAGRFAGSRFSNGDNYILPGVDVNVTRLTDIPTTETFVGNPFPELVRDAPVVVKQITVDERNVVLYGSNTQSGQIVLLAYSSETGQLLGTKYLGFSNPYQLASFNSTEDGGLVVLGNTAVAGRFARFCLFKLSIDELRGFTE